MDPISSVVEKSHPEARHNAPDGHASNDNASDNASNYGFEAYPELGPNISITNQNPGHDNLEKEPDSRGWGSCEEHVNNDQLYCQLQEGETRVLEILPAMKGAVKSRLHCIRLGDLDYCALSYAWGDLKKPKVSVFVNEHPLEVTENCLFALEELRRESMAQSKTCIIWVDAICINQKDVGERSQQVALMRKIYGSATNLIVWLGPEKHDTRDAIATMEELAEACLEGCFEQ